MSTVFVKFTNIINKNTKQLTNSYKIPFFGQYMNTGVPSATMSYKAAACDSGMLMHPCEPLPM